MKCSPEGVPLRADSRVGVDAGTGVAEAVAGAGSSASGSCGDGCQVAALAKQEKLADWRWVQKQFERLRLHRKQNDGLNLWTCEVAGPSRRLHGYLLTSPNTLFHETPPDNPYLRLLNSNAKHDESAPGGKNDDERI